MEGAHLAGRPAEAVMLTACAIEMIHCYSLVHDDLPSMDNDDLRRGKPTCHIVYGEANAILTGDALLSRAFELIAANAGVSGVTPDAVVAVIEEVAAAIGSTGMVGGQVLDLQWQGQQIGPAELGTPAPAQNRGLVPSSLAFRGYTGGHESPSAGRPD